MVASTAFGMTTNVKATGLTLSEEIRTYLDKCLSKVEKYTQGDSAAIVQVELERSMSHSGGEVFRGELTVSGSNLSIRAEAEATSLHAAIDVLEDRVVNELRRLKGKRQHIFRRQAKRVKDFIRGWRA